MYLKYTDSSLVFLPLNDVMLGKILTLYEVVPTSLKCDNNRLFSLSLKVTRRIKWAHVCKVLWTMSGTCKVLTHLFVITIKLWKSMCIHWISTEVPSKIVIILHLPLTESHTKIALWKYSSNFITLVQNNIHLVI